MITSKVIYNGDLRTKMTHEKSKVQIISDAPIDNQGKGEAFSPTDMVATALASCMITVMGIKARDKKWDITGTHAEVVKIMSPAPRSIQEVKINIQMHHPQLDTRSRELLEKAAYTCPVALSLHPDMLQTVTFNWSE